MGVHQLQYIPRLRPTGVWDDLSLLWQNLEEGDVQVMNIIYAQILQALQ